MEQCAVREQLANTNCALMVYCKVSARIASREIVQGTGSSQADKISL